MIRENLMHTSYIKYLFILLCLKAAAMLLVILHAGIGLGPDEAQYWTWAQQLDWGYYSKPPGIAWQNWLGTSLFGNTELGVRSMALMVGFVLPLLVYATAKACRLTPSACFWAAVAIAFSPLGILSSFLSITDGGMILFWTAACAYTAKCIEQDEGPNYYLLGMLILFGALFKWPIYLFWILMIGMWSLYPHLISRRIVLGVIISLLALVPSAYWNASHDWVTFRHVWATIAGGHAPKPVGAVSSANFFEYLGAQALLVFPILFILFLMASWRLFIAKSIVSKPKGVVFCALITLVILGTALSLSLFMKIQGNWGIFAYPTAFVVIAWYACEISQRAKKWMIGALALSVLLCALAFSIPRIQSNNVSKIPLSYKINLFRHNMGWKTLERELKAVGYDPQRDFLFGDKYQMASILSFYGETQKRAYFFNISGIRKNQFSFWPGMDKEQKGQRGFFVVTENAPKLTTEASDVIGRYEKLLHPYFEKVRFLGMKPIFYANGEVAKGAFIFECIGYLGQMPEDPLLY